jgi:shikimate dehydrogenase
MSLDVEGADARRAAVLGHPIGHSRSPILHRAAYRALGLSWTYDAIDMTSDAIVDFVTSRGHEWVGLSLTMPLKESVLPALTHVSPVVELTHAANTVVFEANARWGHNTDVSGMVGALAEAGIVGLDSVGILGSGATARSSLVALAELGARDVVMVAREGD